MPESASRPHPPAADEAPDYLAGGAAHRGRFHRGLRVLPFDAPVFSIRMHSITRKKNTKTGDAENAELITAGYCCGCFRFAWSDFGALIRGPINVLSSLLLTSAKGDAAMTRIELTTEETQTLSEILESYLSDLRMEIAATENRDWRGAMKARESFIKDVLSRLAATDA